MNQPPEPSAETKLYPSFISETVNKLPEAERECAAEFMLWFDRTQASQEMIKSDMMAWRGVEHLMWIAWQNAWNWKPSVESDELKRLRQRVAVLEVEIDSRGEWIKKMNTILGYDNYGFHCDPDPFAIASRLRADEQRFRAALVKIMDCGWSQREAYEIAKAAIEGTK